MEDLRLVLAVQVCEEFGFQLFPNRCECGYPMVEKPNQRIPFCWFCACDRKSATVARATLLKAKLAEHGIVMEERRELHPDHYEFYEPQGPFKFGMPL